MAFLYFCKVNVNDEIYSVYKKDKNVSDIIDNLIVNINSNVFIEDEDQKSRIKFVTLVPDIDRRYVCGRLIKIFTDDIQVYNEKLDDIEDIPSDRLTRSCTFYFDAKTEIVAFTVGKYFGYKKFCQYFEILINKCTEEGAFNVTLLQDSELFKSKLKRLSKAEKIEINLVAKNPCEEELNEWYANPKAMEEIEANKLRLIYESQGKKSNGLKIDSGYFAKLLDSLETGYVKFIKVIGKNLSGLKDDITSDLTAPKRFSIPDKDKLSIPAVHEHGATFIPRLMSFTSGKDK